MMEIFAIVFCSNGSCLVEPRPQPYYTTLQACETARETYFPECQVTRAGKVCMAPNASFTCMSKTISVWKDTK